LQVNVTHYGEKEKGDVVHRIVIDCDPGIDDAHAIMMAYMHPDVRIEAITSVAGNVGVKLTTANVLKILDVLQAGSIPVFAGAASAFIPAGEDASFFHGLDGLGNSQIPESNRPVEQEHAALALIRIAKENPGELELIAIGPLTNLALALSLEPDLPSYYKSLVIMGGAHFAQGNTKNLPAEFNIYSDPDSAAKVFRQWPRFTMVSWEATIQHGIPIDVYQSLLKFDNPRSRFLERITRNTFEVLMKIFNRDLSYAADPLAMAVLLEPGIVLDATEVYVEVERCGGLTRGMTVVDWLGVSKKEPNVTLIKGVDQDRFFELLKIAVE
jgi:purine nucleosidase